MYYLKVSSDYVQNFKATKKKTTHKKRTLTKQMNKRVTEEKL